MRPVFLLAALFLAGTASAQSPDTSRPGGAGRGALGGGAVGGRAGALSAIEATATDVFLAEGNVGVERLAARIRVASEPGADAAGRPLTFAPNPTAGRTAVTFALAEASDVEAEVLDVLGRRVRTLASGPATAGEQRLLWDGRDAAGHRVAPGVHSVRVRAGGAVRARRLTVVR